LRMTQREDDVLQRYREYRQRSGAGAGNTWNAHTWLMFRNMWWLADTPWL
jgi:hypothetical protein